MKAYLFSPNKLELHKETQRFLAIDRVVQWIRKIIMSIMTKHHLLLTLILAVYMFENLHYYKYESIFILAIIESFNFFPKLFYFGDHITSIFNVLISAYKGTSEFLAKSYLDLTKIKSKNYDFVYYDKNINNEDINFYENCIYELLDIFPSITSYMFNVLVLNEDDNTLDESRKMIGIYDSLNLKLYDYHPSLIGLYSPAGATIICKCISKEYIKDLLDNYNFADFNPESLKYVDDIYSLRKHILYHEFAHMISMNISPEFFLSEEFQNAFNIERDRIFLDSDSYFKYDFNEFVAEVVSDCLEAIAFKNESNISYRDTKVYNMVKHYIKSVSLNLNLEEDV